MPSEGGGLDPDNELVKDLLMKEKGALVTHSLKELKVLGDRLTHGEITKEDYQREVDEIKRKILKFDEQIKDLKQGGDADSEPQDAGTPGGASSAKGESKAVMAGMNASGQKPALKPHPASKASATVFNAAFDSGKKSSASSKAKEYLKTAAIVLVLVSIPIYLYMNATCVFVNPSTKAFRIISLLGLIKDKSPSQYDMICNYATKVDYLYKAGETDSVGGKMFIDSAVLSKDRDELPAAFLVHEGCRNMMSSLSSELKGLSAEEADRPCQREMYLFLYKSGYFKSYAEMVDALKDESQTKSLTYSEGIPLLLRPDMNIKMSSRITETKEFCAQTKIQIVTDRSKDTPTMTFTNTGTTVVKCCLIELDIRDREYPLGCGELKPGDSYTTTPDMLPSTDYAVKFVGCDKVIT